MRLHFLVELCLAAARRQVLFFCSHSLSHCNSCGRTHISSPLAAGACGVSVGQGRCSTSPLLSPFAISPPCAPLSRPLAPPSQLFAGWVPLKNIWKCVLKTPLWNTSAEPRMLAPPLPSARSSLSTIRWLGPSQGNGRASEGECLMAMMPSLCTRNAFTFPHRRWGQFSCTALQFARGWRNRYYSKGH